MATVKVARRSVAKHLSRIRESPEVPRLIDKLQATRWTGRPGIDRPSQRRRYSLAFPSARWSGLETTRGPQGERKRTTPPPRVQATTSFQEAAAYAAVVRSMRRGAE